MTNNDIIRRLRYIWDFDDEKMIALFRSADLKVTREEISAWLKRDEEEGHVEITDKELGYFLNGLINDKRGKLDGPQIVPNERISNNSILMKIKIALNLKAEEVIEVLKIAEFKLSTSELSAFFRKPDHQHYRVCKDQVLRNFLKGLQLKFRPKH